ncbi:thioesterase family protein [Desulfospira joergensenii]|uniref:thioesterase family protein n=1 Tax=Desulfospira joergensenii TaxID=53329 RepID=UPI001FC934A8|nr:thioesterase family protein [Desulfospira joergensenii]
MEAFSFEILNICQSATFPVDAAESQRRRKMKETLKPGIEHEFSFTITESKLVPALYPEAEEFRVMPDVFATGYMVGLIEWVCIQALNPHLDWPEEQSVGTRIDVSHLAATPPGLEVLVKVRLVEKEGRRLVFEVEAHDSLDLISKGRHERFIINKTKFDLKQEEKIRAAAARDH